MRKKAFYVLVIATVGIFQSNSQGPDSSKARAATASIFALINRESKIDPSIDSGITLEVVKGNIRFNHVSFSYPTRPDIQIFQDMCLEVQAGKSIALVGESGSGKSTAIALLQRFYDPDSGHISVDGIDLHQFQLRWLRQQMGLVSQEPVLFNDTIHANIAYGNQDGKATQAEIIVAAELANAHNFICSLQQVICKLDLALEKEERKRDLEQKLHVLNEKKHYLVQMLKQILNAEEEIKRRSILSAPTARSSVPLQAEASAEMNYAARNPPKIAVEVNFGGDVGGESDAAGNYSIQARQWPPMPITSPSTTSIGKTSHGPFHHTVHVPRVSAAHQVTSSSLMAGSMASPSRFAPTGQHGYGHSMSFPAVSVSGTHLPASSQSPAASGGTSSAFRDSHW